VENVNSLVDISVIAGGDIVSSLKGQLISSVGASDMKKVESCTLQSDKVSIKNTFTKTAVKMHVSHIRDKMKATPDLTETLQKRVRSLTSSCIEIALPDDISYASDAMELDEAIRRIVALMSNAPKISSIVTEHVESLEKILDGIGCVV